MPIGGGDIAWDNTTPADTESAGLGDDRIRSMKTSLQVGINQEHNWPAGGGLGTGYHLLGSARPFYDLQSLVSSSGSDGRLMMTSDTSQLFGVGSAGTVLFGGATVISAGSFPGTLPQRYQWAMEFGRDITGSNGSVIVSFPNSGYSGVPFVYVTPEANFPTFASAVLNTPTQFHLVGWNLSGVLAASRAFHWMSIGTRVL